ncbi:C40 family peptidase [Nocardioides sp. LHG3406-4]|uniref:C40 family peptidase n=1 Tax=Nocardioides sp. LHG3406-4 TaxID=2804575 RepID=UPI003CF387BF
MPATSRMLRFGALMMLCLGLVLGTPTAVSAQSGHGGSTEKLSQKVKLKRATKVRVHRAEHIALAQRGDAYSYGSAGPGAFDCSGLIYYSFRKAGFSAMPRTSSAQAGHVRRIPKSQLHRGDLMFFTGGGGVYHVGIFVGRLKSGAVQMLHSSTPGRPVQIDVPWTSSWFAGTMRRA